MHKKAFRMGISVYIEKFGRKMIGEMSAGGWRISIVMTRVSGLINMITVRHYINFFTNRVEVDCK